MKNLAKIGLWSTSAALIVSCAPLMAQTTSSSLSDTAAEADGSGEIVVTATLRNERLQDVPVSVSSFDRSKLDQQGIKDITDVARNIPGLNFTAVGDRAGQFTIAIRGVQSEAGAATTGVYIDDVAVQTRKVAGTGLGTPFPRIFDLERVEVLRGPQGTLFGAGSQGGTLRFITPQPSLNRTSMYARGELSKTKYGDPNYEMGVAFGMPIVEGKIGARVSAWFRQDGGWIDRINRQTGNVEERGANGQKAYTVRAAIRAEVSENFTLTPSVFVQQETRRGPSSFWEELSNPDNGVFRDGRNIAVPSRDKFWIPSLNAELDLGSVKMISITSYIDRKVRVKEDWTAFVGAQLLANPRRPASSFTLVDLTSTQKSFSQEVRIQSGDTGPFRWIVGGYYQRSKQTAFQVVIDPTAAQEIVANRGRSFTQLFGQEPINGNILFIQDPFNTLDKQISGFAQVDYDITDKLTLTAGARISKTSFSYNALVLGPIGSRIPQAGKQSESPITPKFGAQYKFDDDHNVYASAAKGFRVGGVNQQPVQTCLQLLASQGLTFGKDYDSDSVWSYEIGSKNQFAGGRVIVNGSAFQIKWDNIQQIVTIPGCSQGYTSNLGKATSTGFDLELQFRVGDALRIGAAVGYQNAKYDLNVFLLPGRSTVSKGDHLPGSPWKVALNAQYDFADLFGKEGYLRADYQYQSEDANPQSQENPGNLTSFDNTFYHSPATHYVTMRGGIKLDAFDISLFVDNVFDSSPTIRRIATNRAAPFRVTSFRPRTVGVTGILRY
jgi:iron complex outermembrane recepter protein